MPVRLLYGTSDAIYEQPEAGRILPVVLGRGKRRFGDGSPSTTLRLADAKPVGPAGVVVLTYERA